MVAGGRCRCYGVQVVLKRGNATDVDMGRNIRSLATAIAGYEGAVDQTTFAVGDVRKAAATGDGGPPSHLLKDNGGAKNGGGGGPVLRLPNRAEHVMRPRDPGYLLAAVACRKWSTTMTVRKMDVSIGAAPPIPHTPLCVREPRCDGQIERCTSALQWHPQIRYSMVESGLLPTNRD